MKGALTAAACMPATWSGERALSVISTHALSGQIYFHFLNGK